jgi:hypothetical protein
MKLSLSILIHFIGYVFVRKVYAQKSSFSLNRYAFNAQPNEERLLLMNKKHYHLLIFSSILLCNSTLHGQTQQTVIQRSCINSFGSSVTKNNLYLHQSAGQATGYTQSKTELYSFYEGVVQPVLNYDSGKTTSIECYVIPNPNAGEFQIITNLDRENSFEYSILDSFGKVVHHSKGKVGNASNAQISLIVEPGLYTLQIIDSNGQRGATKIIII